MDPNSLLFLDNRIYVPSAGNLHIHVLQYNHDHIFAGHYGQNKTLELVHRRYSWSSLYADIQQFCKSCVTCMQSKLQHHKFYRFLKQLPISKWLWNSISMDHIRTHSCHWLGIQFSHCISRQAWSSPIVLNTLLHLPLVSIHFQQGFPSLIS